MSKMPQTRNLGFKLLTATHGQPVSLFFARCVLLLESFYPIVIKEPPDSSVESSRTEPHSTFAQLFHLG